VVVGSVVAYASGVGAKAGAGNDGGWGGGVDSSVVILLLTGCFDILDVGFVLNRSQGDKTLQGLDLQQTSNELSTLHCERLVLRGRGLATSVETTSKESSIKAAIGIERPCARLVIVDLPCS
jgi:hypothetical protein